MKRQVKYRFLKDKNNAVMGIAHSGYEEDYEMPNNNMTCFIYGRLEGTYAFQNPIEALTIKDVYQYGFDDSYQWGVMESYEASGTEDEITPSDLVEKRWAMEYEMKRVQHRKTA